MKSDYIEFYVNKFSSVTTVEDADVNFISPILRRRLSKLDRCLFSVLKNVFTDDVENIVLSSQRGEHDRLLKLIEQYKSEKEVSPNTFSGSVHNYPVGFFLLDMKKSIPYTALAACDNSLSAGLLSTLIADYNKLVFCYCDNSNDYCALGANISLLPSDGGVKYVLHKGGQNDKSDSFKEYSDFFEGKTTRLISRLFTIERAEV